MWADTLLAVERAHLIRLSMWGGASLLVGSALLALMQWSGHDKADDRQPPLAAIPGDGVQADMAPPGVTAIAVRST